mgnify:CR=1 FL=1
MSDQFHYRGRDGRGALAEGKIAGTSADAVANELLGRGIVPLEIKRIAASKSAADMDLANLPLFRKKVDLDELIIFCRQMYALTKAGISIIRIIRGLADNTRSPVMKDTLLDIAQRLEGGVGMAVALQAHPEVFSDLFVSMVHVGENTGQLDEAFNRLSAVLELERSTRRQVKQALRYPIFVLVAIISAVLVVNVFVIPKFASVFAKLGADLPLLTQVLVATSDILVNYWWSFLFVVAASIVGFRQWKKTEQGKLTWDQYKLRFPLIGPLLERITLSRFSRNFATMLAAGMPVTRALTVAGDASDNAWMGQRIRHMRAGIESGDTLLRVARHSELFTPLILQMIAVGEETGAVDAMLDNVADFYDEEVDYDLKRLAESIEPILIVSMGVLVLILALGVFLPIWDLGAAATGRG